MTGCKVVAVTVTTSTKKDNGRLMRQLSYSFSYRSPVE